MKKYILLFIVGLLIGGLFIWSYDKERIKGSLFITITPMQFSLTQTGDAGFSREELKLMIDGFLGRAISKGYVPEKEKPEKIPEKET